jgi:hypothetical protein
MVDDAGGHHQARIERASCDSTKGMPCSYSPSVFPLLLICGGQPTIVEPVPETVEAILHQIFCGAEVKPRIDWCTLSEPGSGGGHPLSANCGMRRLRRGGRESHLTFVNNAFESWKTELVTLAQRHFPPEPRYLTYG